MTKPKSFTAWAEKTRTISVIGIILSLVAYNIPTSEVVHAFSGWLFVFCIPVMVIGSAISCFSTEPTLDTWCLRIIFGVAIIALPIAYYIDFLSPNGKVKNWCIDNKGWYSQDGDGKISCEEDPVTPIPKKQ